MADAPKKEGEGLTLFERSVLFLIFLYFLTLLWWRIEDFLIYYRGSSDFGSITPALAAYFHTHIVPLVRIIGTIIAALALFGIVHSYTKLSVIKKEEDDIYGAKSPGEDEVASVMKNEKWERIIAHVNSSNASDWRLAIIEADIMLDDLLKTLGYHGDTMGERLKSVDKSDMLTLDNAWEAHRIRNQVAHQGAEYPLSDREAKRAIALYESVFREFKVI